MKACRISVILISQFTLKIDFLHILTFFRIPINKFIYKQIKNIRYAYCEKPNFKY